MTNFEHVIHLFMMLLMDFNLGLSRPLRRMVATLTACLLEGTAAHLTALAEALPDVETDHIGFGASCLILGSRPRCFYPCSCS